MNLDIARVRNRRRGKIVFMSLAALFLVISVVHSDDATTAVENRLRDSVKYLASDELEGRGVGSEGLDEAAEYVREQFEEAGLDVHAVNNGAYQSFGMTIGAEMEEGNRLVFHGPSDETITGDLEKDFMPLSFGSSGPFKGDLAFLGYGIEADDEEYNDFTGIDVKGKVVIIMRRTPQQGNPHGKFSGGPHGGISRHAALRSKASNAFSAGAAAVLFVNDPHSGKTDLDSAKKRVTQAEEKLVEAAVAFDAVDPEQAESLKEAREKLSAAVKALKERQAEVAAGMPDELMKFGYAGKDKQHDIPLMHITRELCDRILKTAGKTLAGLEEQIDEDLKPRSFVIEGWTADGATSIRRIEAEVKNVIGVLEGAGPLADETIVIGAHYDHVGRGGEGSLAPGSKEIHNGADDNASGTVALIELARRFAASQVKPPRRLVFIAFTGEELGLLGSAHYVKEPIFPLDKTVAMINMDMVGRLKDEKLTIFGTGTAKRWDDMVDRLAKEYGFTVTKKPDGFGPSDHSSFYGKKIPVLHFFTGTHSDYHRPGDDWEKINVSGMRRVVDMIQQLVTETASKEERPAYVAVKSSSNERRDGNRPYFGSIPDFGQETPGYALMGVSPDSPAAKAGLKGGDVIVDIDMRKIGNLSDFDLALRKYKAGDTIKVTVRRGKEQKTLDVTLDKPR